LHCSSNCNCRYYLALQVCSATEIRIVTFSGTSQLLKIY